MLGQRLGSFRILEKLGEGGMGVVYRAEDTRLGRQVALKLLSERFRGDQVALERLFREARAASALNHPNICTIHDIKDEGGRLVIVMEVIEGQTLQARIDASPLAIAELLQFAIQISDALDAAHAKGVVHRDIKPGNVLITTRGQAKILDFGLAKLVPQAFGVADIEAEAVTAEMLTTPGTTLGTVNYMSPEQVRGEDIDVRSDLFSCGVMLYQMATGRLPFTGRGQAAILDQVLHTDPERPRQLRPDLPGSLESIILRCLEKAPAARYQSAGALLADLRKCQASISEENAALNLRALARRALSPQFAVPLVVAVVLLGFLGLREYQRSARARWVRDQAVPEIRRLLDDNEFRAAFRLIRQAEAILPQDRALKQTLQDATFEVSFTTNPLGADVWATGYSPDDNDWFYLGTTPFRTKMLPPGYYRLRVAKTGFRTILVAGGVPGPPMQFDLDAEGSIPSDMVRVPGGTPVVDGLDAKVASFLIDRLEVTNRQFKQFIDRGGYEKQEYWKQDFVKNGRKLSWEEAMSLLRDSTGRPGPSTWELGEYPQGRDDYPVNGVSWYEAAAYAEFAGKQLPTIYHWQQAAAPGYFADVTELSNFAGSGPARAGSYQGLGAFGTLDMAGNVKEWCWNEVRGQRSIRGGAWNEPAYMFSTLEVREPWDRAAQNGIRLARYDPVAAAESRVSVPPTVRDFNKEKPVPDEVFQLYSSLYAYDRTDLKAASEGFDQDNAYWKREKVSFAAVYGNERILGYLYIPKHAKPPYQTIIFSAPTSALQLPEPQRQEEHYFDFIVKSGRAFLIPVLKGQFQRRYSAPSSGRNEARDRLILESKDFRRSIDYLVSRADVDGNRLGVYGLSRGGIVPILAVGEQRLKAAALVSVGLGLNRPLPENDAFNFLPRFRVPTVMINGRFDFIFPLETSARPMLRLLGAPEADKRLVVQDTGHLPPTYQTAIKETLDWFDHYLGPVGKE